MRILHVSERVWPMGGAERLLHDTCGRLSQLGHEVHALVAEDTPAGPFALPLHRLARSRGPRVAQRVKPALDALLDRVQPDVIHVHNAQDFLSPLLLHHLQRCAPTLRYVHDARLVCPRVPSKHLARGGLCPYAMGLRCLAHCAPVDCGGGYTRTAKELALLYGDLAVTRRLPAVLVGSRYMHELMRLNGFDAQRLHLLPGFTDKALHVRVDAHSTEPGLILAIGRFDGIKGLEDLPRILAALRAPHWRAVIVGSGPGHAATRAAVAAAGWEDRVQFIDSCSSAELDAWYAQAAVVVMPSRVPEAFGLVGIEAMAFGKPVVAMDIGGVREWLQDGQTGWLAPPGALDALARGIDRLLADPAAARQMGQRGRARVDQCFRPEQHLRQLLAVYASLAPAGGDRRHVPPRSPHPCPLPLMRERAPVESALAPSPASAGEGRGEGLFASRSGDSNV